VIGFLSGPKASGVQVRIKRRLLAMVSQYAKQATRAMNYLRSVGTDPQDLKTLGLTPHDIRSKELLMRRTIQLGQTPSEFQSPGDAPQSAADLASMIGQPKQGANALIQSSLHGSGNPLELIDGVAGLLGGVLADPNTRNLINNQFKFGVGLALFRLLNFLDGKLEKPRRPAGPKRPIAMPTSRPPRRPEAPSGPAPTYCNCVGPNGPFQVPCSSQEGAGCGENGNCPPWVCDHWNQQVAPPDQMAVGSQTPSWPAGSNFWQKGSSPAPGLPASLQNGQPPSSDYGPMPQTWGGPSLPSYLPPSEAEYEQTRPTLPGGHYGPLMPGPASQPAASSGPSGPNFSTFFPSGGDTTVINSEANFSTPSQYGMDGLACVPCALMLLGLGDLHETQMQDMWDLAQDLDRRLSALPDGATKQSFLATFNPVKINLLQMQQQKDWINYPNLFESQYKRNMQILQYVDQELARRTAEPTVVPSVPVQPAQDLTPFKPSVSQGGTVWGGGSVPIRPIDVYGPSTPPGATTDYSSFLKTFAIISVVGVAGYLAWRKLK